MSTTIPNGSNGHKSSAERILGIFNSWQQFGAVGVLAVTFCLVVGAGLYFIGKMINGSTEQHAADVKQYLTAAEAQQRELATARNREIDAFLSAVRQSGSVTSRSVDTLSEVVKEQSQRNNKVIADLAEELRSNRAVNKQFMEKATGTKFKDPGDKKNNQ